MMAQHIGTITLLYLGYRSNEAISRAVILKGRSSYSRRVSKSVLITSRRMGNGIRIHSYREIMQATLGLPQVPQILGYALPRTLVSMANQAQATRTQRLLTRQIHHKQRCGVVADQVSQVLQHWRRPQCLPSRNRELFVTTESLELLILLTL